MAAVLQGLERSGGARAAAVRALRGLVLPVAIFGAALNALLLTGPLFMLQVYDRVLGSGSEATLLALLAIVVFLHAMMFLIDLARSRVMARAALVAGAALAPAAMAAALDHAPHGPPGRAARGIPGPPHADALQRLVASPAALALLDLPWAPLFLAMIFVLHPALGALALAGGAALVAVALGARALGRRRQDAAAAAAGAAAGLADELRSGAETLRGLGMGDAALRRWSELRAQASLAELALADLRGDAGAAGRALRHLLQAALLGLGAWLVLRAELTPGAMIAASVLLGRALAPVEQTIAHWESVRQGLEGWRALGAVAVARPAAPRKPQPARAGLEVEGLSLLPPGAGQPLLPPLSFALAPGQVLGVLGASGTGKTALARTLAGVWPAAAGRMLLGGARLDGMDPRERARRIGYLPQEVTLFPGTVAENIARLEADADPGTVRAAAARAGAHDMIVALPGGYHTPISARGAPLSAGQVRRIGLARAFYGDPGLLVLDEPDANLDTAGCAALHRAIRDARARGATVVLLTHRTALVALCDSLLALGEEARPVAAPARTAAPPLSVVPPRAAGGALP